MDIDIEQLRKDLIDYYGTAMFNASPMALMDVSKAEKANGQELIRMAQAAGLNLNQYQR
ncbi:MAG: hypothetical protein LUH07_05090 [Lachnospiraceae bacterium]|nr:hypothetical protein [Lachnospiraceae bacterium]